MSYAHTANKALCIGAVHKRRYVTENLSIGELIAIVVNADTGELMGCIYDDPLKNIKNSSCCLSTALNTEA